MLAERDHGNHGPIERRAAAGPAVCGGAVELAPPENGPRQSGPLGSFTAPRNSQPSALEWTSPAPPPRCPAAPTLRSVQTGQRAKIASPGCEVGTPLGPVNLLISRHRSPRVDRNDPDPRSPGLTRQRRELEAEIRHRGRTLTSRPRAAAPRPVRRRIETMTVADQITALRRICTPSATAISSRAADSTKPARCPYSTIESVR